MPRKPRVHYEGALYHVIVRGNNRSKVFQSNKDKYLYLGLIKKYKEKYDFKLYSYCILDNHAHLLIEVAKAPLSKIMQSIQQVYTQKYNKTYERTGHAFEQRYKGILCDKESYLLSLIRYIHANPVKAHAAEGMDYRWSSHREYISQRSSVVDLEFPLSLFSQDKTKQRRLYTEFVTRQPDDGIEDYELAADEVVLLAQNSKNGIGPGDEKIQLELDMIIDSILDYFGLSRAVLRSKKRNREISLARRAIIILSKEYTNESNITISQALGVTESLVSRVDKDLLETDGVLEEACGRIRNRIKNENGIEGANNSQTIQLFKPDPLS